MMRSLVEEVLRVTLGSKNVMATNSKLTIFLRVIATCGILFYVKYFIT